MQIDYFEYFLGACRNICVIDIVDNETIEGSVTKTEKITTIKLKNSILKELILESRNDPMQSDSHKDQSQMLNWQSEYKKKIGDFQFQNDTIHQLLDIFISQIKGGKNSSDLQKTFPKWFANKEILLPSNAKKIALWSRFTKEKYNYELESYAYKNNFKIKDK